MRGHPPVIPLRKECKMPKITMYTTAVCPFCMRAKKLLEKKGMDLSTIDEIRVDIEPEKREEMMAKTGRKTVPQIWIGDTWIGGFDDLAKSDADGKLDSLLNP